MVKGNDARLSVDCTGRDFVSLGASVAVRVELAVVVDYRGSEGTLLDQQ